MALDLAIVLACSQGWAPPTVRVFAFVPHCLSLGRNQDEPWLLERCKSLGIPWARRPTGGGAVLHAGDVCFSVVAPANDSKVGGSVRRSYCQISEAVVWALAAVGIDRVEICQGPPPTVRGGICFATSAPWEVTAQGAKLVGHAQWRHRGVILHQGVIRMRGDTALETQLFGRSLGPDLCELLGQEVSYSNMVEALRRGFAKALNLELVSGRLTGREMELALALAS